jgi:hypothetical protein
VAASTLPAARIGAIEREMIGVMRRLGMARKLDFDGPRECVFCPILQPRFRRFWHRFRLAEALVIDDDAVGTVAQSIERGGAQDAVVGERIAPFAEVQI